VRSLERHVNGFRCPQGHKSASIVTFIQQEKRLKAEAEALSRCLAKVAYCFSTQFLPASSHFLPAFPQSSLFVIEPPVGLLVAAHDCPVDSKNAIWNRFLVSVGRSYPHARRSKRAPSAYPRCVRLAQTFPSQQARDQFANLARTWIRLADEIERTEAFLATLDDETEPISKPVSS
jgi:hypothetical protein